MNPVRKALWYIEAHFAQDLALDDIANSASVSRFHISRAFGAATGESIMGYVRGRRLSEAARALANGAPDILDVALQSGYGSHEAFTRAFRDQFGRTPEAVRAQGHLNDLKLVEPIKMEDALIDNLEPPRIVNSKRLLIAGLSERYGCQGAPGSQSASAIPSQWQRFMPHFGNIPGQVGRVAYGVCYNFDELGNFDYLCGAEVADFASLPPDISRVRVAEQRYAVFEHRGHVSGIRNTWNTVWNKWLPESGEKAADAPNLERYTEAFSGETGMGGVELWVPLETARER